MWMANPRKSMPVAEGRGHPRGGQPKRQAANDKQDHDEKRTR